jgi:low temperature requirement protein LtrA
MSAAGPASSQRENESTIEQGATPLELFFDLVVFAFTQVVSFLSDHLTWAGMLQGER